VTHDAVPPSEGQLRNVDAILVAVTDPADANPLAERLATLCTEVLLVGDGFREDTVGRRVTAEDRDDPLALVAAGLRAATAERVLVVAADVPPNETLLLLALLAWPEADVVLPRTSDDRRHALCAVYRREAALLAADRAISAQTSNLDANLAAWLDALAAEELSGADLAAVILDESALR
jgi:molybdopterin-guanine dinucleotide biosynthesis protein A